jgi:hypothetical protein
MTEGIDKRLANGDARAGAFEGPDVPRAGEDCGYRAYVDQAAAVRD